MRTINEPVAAHPQQGISYAGWRRVAEWSEPDGRQGWWAAWPSFHDVAVRIEIVPGTPRIDDYGFARIIDDLATGFREVAVALASMPLPDAKPSMATELRARIADQLADLNEQARRSIG